MVVADGSEAQAPRPQYGQVSPAFVAGPVPGALTSAGSGEGRQAGPERGGALGSRKARRPHGGHQAARHLHSPA